MIISDTVVDQMLVAAVAMESRRCNAVFLDAAAKTEQLTLVRIDLAVAAEREACAKLIEQMADDAPGPKGVGVCVLYDVSILAKAIRARGVE